MTKSTKTAKFQLLQLINKLSRESKSINSEELISLLDAIKPLCSNKPFIDNLLQSLKVINQSKNPYKSKLTKREKQVFLLIGEGLKNTSIAVELNLSKSTIETHRKNIRKKLQLNNNDNLFVIALLFSMQYQND